MKVLVTGITGMAGSHLADYLLTLPDVEVYGIFRRRSPLDNLQDIARSGRLNQIASGGNTSIKGKLEAAIEGQSSPDKVNLIEGDIADAFSMRRIIGALRPDRIFHLAAQSYVPASWSTPAETFELNVIGQVNLFEAIRDAGIDPLVQIAGSSEEYGLVYPDEAPIRESNPLRPLSPYAVSKVAQEMLALQYNYSYGLRAVVTRGFNHTGPRRGVVFVTSNFARQIAEIEKGLRPSVIEVGDLTSRRDWTDVRDVVRAYWLALEKGKPGEVYNVGSGTNYAVGDMLEILLAMARVDIQVVTDPSRMRPSDVKLLWSDPSKFRGQTGWETQYNFKQTLWDLLEYWRERV